MKNNGGYDIILNVSVYDWKYRMFISVEVDGGRE